MGRVAGRPGTSLAGGGLWAGGGEIGLRHGAIGEQSTAHVLDTLAGRSKITVLHDLRVPIPGLSINIDHVVVAGRTVLLIDSKRWRPGFYWTVNDRTRIGLVDAPHVDKKSVALAHKASVSYLASADAYVPTPLVTVWPSRGRVSLWAARFPGARLVHGRRLARAVKKAVKVGQNADPDIVARLAPLLVHH